MELKKWDRKLGTSKREQGILTPKSIRNVSVSQKKAKKKARLLGRLKDYLKGLIK